MSDNYRLQPPSPFPYSGGSRMEQSLVPALQGPNSSSMIGYALGAQLQRQADQMNYEQDMGEYNLTAQREGERARQEMLADRAEQRRMAIQTALINRHGAVMAPPDYSLTPEQRRVGTEFANANVSLLQNRAEAADRTGRGTGAASARPDPLLVQDLRAIDGQIRAAEAALNALPSRRAQLERAATQGLFRPDDIAAAQRRVTEQLAAEQQRLTEQLAGLRTQRSQVRTPQQPTAQPQAQAAPQAGGTVQGAPPSPSGEVVPPPAAPQAPPRSTSEALQRGIITPERLATARGLGTIRRIEPDGSIIVQTPSGEQRAVR